VIQVTDAKNLRRSLFLTLELAEMDVPFVLALNMSDEALDRGIRIDSRKLSRILGVEVVPTVATTGKGMGALKRTALLARRSSLRVTYDSAIEEAIVLIARLLPRGTGGSRLVPVMLLSGDSTVWCLIDGLGQDQDREIRNIIGRTQEKYGLPLSVVISGRKQERIQAIAEEIISAGTPASASAGERIGEWTTRPWPGIPVALLVVLVMYFFVGRFAAGEVVGFLEETVFGRFISPFLGWLIRGLLPVPLLQDLLVGPYGLLTMALTYAFAIVLPIVAAFFLFFGILEDSGYLPRLAVMADRILRVMGLNGKAVLPMVLGLGCGTMATLTSRILDTRKERIIVTFLLALGVPCSAQLGVIMGMLAGLSPGGALVWVAVVMSVVLLVGILLAHLVPGGRSCFIQEIPPMRVPGLSNILVKVGARLEWYLKEAVPLFMLGTLVLFLGDRFGVLGWLERVGTPLVVGFLGLPAKATEAFLIGFLRRDYGAAGLYVLARQGLLDHVQVVVSVVTITLFIPCIAQFMVMIKERGWKVAMGITTTVLALAFLVGGGLSFLLRALNAQF
jgi:ferrous iron transport protein B